MAKPRSKVGGPAPLLDAALAIVAEDGVAALTVRAVARRARTSPGTVTYHCATSEALLVATFEHGESHMVTLLERLTLDLSDGGGSMEDWARGIAAALARSLQTHRAQHIACYELKLLAARRRALVPASERIQQAYARIARLALRALELADLESATERTVAMISGLLLAELSMPKPNAEKRLRAALLAELQAWSR